MCPWLLRKLPRPSLIFTKFLGKKLQFNLDRFRFSNFYRFHFCRDSLAENFVTYLLPVISLQKNLGKNFLFRCFWKKFLFNPCLDGNYSSEIFLYGFLCREFLVAIFLQIFSVHTFSSESSFE